jgi:hypothetical protein
MRKQITALMILISAGPQIPAQTNHASRAPDTHAPAAETNVFRPHPGKADDPARREKNEQRRSSEQRRLKLMERELQRIGVTEEQKAQITALQQIHKEKMASNAQQISKVRRELSKLLDEGAPMEALEAAIQDVSAAQAEQLRILVHNRLEMERILGKEKNAEFMKNARAQFEKHGRRGGTPLPPRPGLPPKPGRQANPPNPPQRSPAAVGNP